jgi:SpoVK/Ycf46/Vps4 family AAA+-type ATPase
MPTLTDLKSILRIGGLKKTEAFLLDWRFQKLHSLLPGLHDLDQMIGLETVKQQIVDICIYQLFCPTARDELANVVITGPPGVGKTRLCNILAGLFSLTGRTKTNRVFHAKRSDMVGKFLGQTSIKTREVIESAKGGVLFIDEVYSLGSPDGRDSFAKECIDALTQEITACPNDLVVIVAGYPKDVETCFFQQNAGLRRRFPIQIRLPGYSASDLTKILVQKSESSGWPIRSKEKERVAHFINKVYKELKSSAGDLETLLQSSLFLSGKRVWLSPSENEPRNLTLSDIQKGYEKMKDRFYYGKEDAELTSNAMSMFS